MDTIKILQHNVAHLKPYRSTLYHTYRTINPDVILLNSHGLKNSETIKLYGYTSYQINTSEERHDGSAILIRNTIKHKLNDNFMTDVLAITIETTTGPITIATTYLPPRRPYLPYPDFHTLASNNNPTYIIGDFNAKHTYLGDNYNNTVGTAIKNMMDYNLLKHLGPNFPTYFATNTQSTPDIILANKHAFLNITSTPGPDTASDHTPIIINKTSKSITAAASKRPNYKQANWELFKTEVQHNIEQASPPETATPTQIDDSLSTWYSVVTQAMKNHIPQTTQITIMKAINNPTIKYIQAVIINLKTQADLLGWTLSKYTTYKTLKRLLVEECKKQQTHNWEKKIQYIATKYSEPAHFWKSIKQLKGNKEQSSPYITYNNIKLYSPEEQEPIFRNIWQNIFQISEEDNRLFDQNNDTRVNNYINIHQNITSPYTTADTNRLMNDNYLTKPITTSEVERIIKKMKNNAPGASQISKLILTKLPDTAIKILTTIFNLSLSLGYFPDKFKAAKLILIPKPGKQGTNPIDYRPISLLEVPGKILEKVINTRFSTHLEANNILPQSQHGFRKNRGTETALAITTEVISHALAEKKQCYLVLRDVSKAFDKVWHNGLKYKIIKLQLPPIITKILCTFLDRRTATICYQVKSKHT